MNRKLFSLIVVAFSAVMLPTIALAQSDLHVRANVPFAFTVENKTFSAGTYDITQLEPSLLTVRNADGSMVAVVKVSENRSELVPSPNPSLVFHRFGAKYFLSQITAARSAEAMTVRSGSQEKELSRATRELITVPLISSQSGK